MYNKNKFKLQITYSKMKEEADMQNQAPDELIIKIKDLEEKQKIFKDRALMIGQNLIDFKEKTNEKTLELKKEIEEIKRHTEKIKTFMENISREFANLARKDDLEILSKQLKMFKPLEYLKDKTKI